MFKNRKFIIISILLIILLFCFNDVEASTSTIEYNNLSFPSSVVIEEEEIYLKSTDYIWFIGKGYIGNTSSNPIRTFLVINNSCLKSSGSVICLDGMGGSDARISLDKYGNGVEGFYLFELIDNSWSFICNGKSGTILVNIQTSLSCYTGNVDVLSDSGSTYISGVDFFPIPPVGVIAPMMEKVEMKITMKEIILILPLIIVVVVSLVGLRKALKMLLTLLRRCLII